VGVKEKRLKKTNPKRRRKNATFYYRQVRWIKRKGDDEAKEGGGRLGSSLQTHTGKKKKRRQKTMTRCKALKTRVGKVCSIIGSG